MKRKLRLGILYKHDHISAWLYSMLSKIVDGRAADIVLLIKQDAFTENERKNDRFVYDLYKKLDRKYFQSSPSAFERKNIFELLDVTTIEENQIDFIKEFDLDVLIQLEPALLKNEFKQLAKYGVWSFHFGNFKIDYSQSCFFWEVVEKHDEIGITLLMHKSAETKILNFSTSVTDKISVARNLNVCFWKATSILPRKIDELFDTGEKIFFSRIKKLNENFKFHLNKNKTIPSNKEAFIKILNFKWSRVKRIFKSFFHFNQWIILYKFDHFSSNTPYNFQEFKKIIPPKDRLWADPHVIEKNNKYYIFIEELIYKKKKGFISVIEMDYNGNYNAPVKILDKEYHLSFPSIIEDNGTIYMIPETSERENIQLYKCIDFPYEWQLETVLVNNVQAVDSVIIKKNDKYWLFTTIAQNKGASLHDELHLYHSDSLVSENWKEHHLNPIVSDVKNARLAGKLFMHNGKIYRPAQNCSNHYGFGMNINEVVELNELNYSERIVDSILPDWDKKIISTHSFTLANNLIVIDAQFIRKKFF